MKGISLPKYFRAFNCWNVLYTDESPTYLRNLLGDLQEGDFSYSEPIRALSIDHHYYLIKEVHVGMTDRVFCFKFSEERGTLLGECLPLCSPECDCLVFKEDGTRQVIKAKNVKVGDQMLVATLKGTFERKPIVSITEENFIKEGHALQREYGVHVSGNRPIVVEGVVFP